MTNHLNLNLYIKTNIYGNISYILPIPPFSEDGVFRRDLGCTDTKYSSASALKDLQVRT